MASILFLYTPHEFNNLMNWKFLINQNYVQQDNFATPQDPNLSDSWPARRYSFGLRSTHVLWSSSSKVDSSNVWSELESISARSRPLFCIIATWLNISMSCSAFRPSAATMSWNEALYFWRMRLLGRFINHFFVLIIWNQCLNLLLQWPNWGWCFEGSFFLQFIAYAKFSIWIFLTTIDKYK